MLDVGSELVVEDDVEVLGVLDVVVDIVDGSVAEVDGEGDCAELDVASCDAEGTSGRWGVLLLFSDRPMAMPMTATRAVATMMMGMLRDFGVPLPDIPLSSQNSCKCETSDIYCGQSERNYNL